MEECHPTLLAKASSTDTSWQEPCTRWWKTASWGALKGTEKRHGDMEVKVAGTEHVECWVTMSTQKFRSVATAIAINLVRLWFQCPAWMHELWFLELDLYICVRLTFTFTSSHSFWHSFLPPVILILGLMILWLKVAFHKFGNTTGRMHFIIPVLQSNAKHVFSSVIYWHGDYIFIWCSKDYSTRSLCVFIVFLEAAPVWTWTTVKIIWKEHRSSIDHVAKKDLLSNIHRLYIYIEIWVSFHSR